jgi:hypothetical protein
MMRYFETINPEMYFYDLLVGFLYFDLLDMHFTSRSVEATSCENFGPYLAWKQFDSLTCEYAKRLYVKALLY